MSKLKQDLLQGKKCEAEYSIQGGVIFKGDRIVVPRNLQAEVLQELHYTHSGIVKMKPLARKYCFWRGIDIEGLNRSCTSCGKVRKNRTKITHQWEEPNDNFQRFHIDYAGPFLNHIFFYLSTQNLNGPKFA